MSDQTVHFSLTPTTGPAVVRIVGPAGEEVFVRPLGERGAVIQAWREANPADVVGLHARVVVASLCDRDGNLLLDDTSLAAVAAWDPAALAWLAVPLLEANDEATAMQERQHRRPGFGCMIVILLWLLGLLTLLSFAAVRWLLLSAG